MRLIYKVIKKEFLSWRLVSLFQVAKITHPALGLIPLTVTLLVGWLNSTRLMTLKCRQYPCPVASTDSSIYVTGASGESSSIHWPHLVQIRF
jgi:hypothetical protein